MTKQDLIDQLIEELEIEDDITEATELETLSEWDSLALLIVITLADEKFGNKLTASDIKKVKTIGELVDLIRKNSVE